MTELEAWKLWIGVARQGKNPGFDPARYRTRSVATAAGSMRSSSAGGVPMRFMHGLQIRDWGYITSAR